VLEQNINTTTPEGKLFFTMVAAFAEFEHSLMVVKTKVNRSGFVGDSNFGQLF
jgi:DNA invertase Pin-like site-specific DNA recombinase